MPQVLALVIAGAGLYAGYKWVRGVIRKGEARMAGGHRHAATGGLKDLGTLEYDAKTGAYRPSKKA